MKTNSAAVSKGGHVAYEWKKQPRINSVLREVYDLFMNNKGIVIDFTIPKNNRSCIVQLTDIYGLDIRFIKCGKWVLAGEWFGMKYVDYIAERLKL